MSPERESKYRTFSDDEEENFITINEILALIKSKGLPVFEQFEAGILETFTTEDLDNFFDTFEKKTGVYRVMTSEIRFAWVMALYLENKNHEKAKQFANYALSEMGKSRWFGKKDLHRVLNNNSGYQRFGKST